MITPAVQCVLFDAVGTLIYPNPPVGAVYAAAAWDFGHRVDEAVVERRVLQAFHNSYDGPSVNKATSETSERNRWREVVAEVFPEITPIDPLFERLWDHFARPENWRVFDDVADCWRRLSDRGIAIGTASNFDRRLVTICRGLPPLDRCRHVFVSSQIGFRKPAVQFFRAIEQAVKLAPQQLMLVGDDWEADYLAAGAAGWHAVHVDRISNLLAGGTIRSLSELGGKLGVDTPPQAPKM
jgi:putative hydrolase of the HAD superfamily